MAWAQRIGARQTWFTHIAHDLGHAETNRTLPAGMAAGLRRADLPRDAMSMHAASARFRSIRSLAEIPAGFGPSVASIGNFDGVHLGHREILSAVVAGSAHSDASAVAVTFDPHPEHFLRPEVAPKLLTPIAERLRLLATTGIDAVLVLPFDAALASHARAGVCAAGARRMRCGVRALHEGGNFRFGHRARLA